MGGYDQQIKIVGGGSWSPHCDFMHSPVVDSDVAVSFVYFLLLYIMQVFYTESPLNVETGDPRTRCILFIFSKSYV